MNPTPSNPVKRVTRPVPARALICLAVCAAVLALDGPKAAAQSTNAPAVLDYSSFRIVADRNIFNPNRYPHTNGRRRTVSRSAPTFSLVGTMTGRDGMLAFFDGTESDYRKVLSVNGTIAGYRVASITLNGVTLTSTNKPIELAVGARMQREGNEWQLAGAGELPAGTVESETPAAEQPAAPPADGEMNDVLKKLMQQREQEMK